MDNQEHKFSKEDLRGVVNYLARKRDNKLPQATSGSGFLEEIKSQSAELLIAGDLQKLAGGEVSIDQLIEKYIEQLDNLELGGRS